MTQDNNNQDDDPTACGAGAEPVGTDEPSGSYEVGRGKPPKHTRFKPGNKFGKGRPKGAKNIATIVNEALGVKVQAKINGKTQKISKGELAVHQLANQASTGNLKAIVKVIELHERYGPAEQDAVSPEEAKADREALRDYYSMLGERQPDQDGEHV